jgi:hypothetical protein
VTLLAPSFAFVHDNAIFGYTSPLSGQRCGSRSSRSSDVAWVDALVDYRRYQPILFNVLTVSTRAFASVTAGATRRSSPKYVGRPDLLRGYNREPYSGAGVPVAGQASRPTAASSSCSAAGWRSSTRRCASPVVRRLDLGCCRSRCPHRWTPLLRCGRRVDRPGAGRDSRRSGSARAGRPAYDLTAHRYPLRSYGYGVRFNLFGFAVVRGTTPGRSTARAGGRSARGSSGRRSDRPPGPRGPAARRGPGGKTPSFATHSTPPPAAHTLPGGAFAPPRCSLLGAALLVLACGGDRRPADASARLASTMRGPDAVLLRIPRGGGPVRAVLYPRVDSVVWRSGEAAPALARVLDFDAEAGVLAAVDTGERPVRVDLRLGTARRASNARLTALAATRGTFYGVDSAGAVTRLTQAGGTWRIRLSPTPSAPAAARRDRARRGLARRHGRAVGAAAAGQPRRGLGARAGRRAAGAARRHRPRVLRRRRRAARRAGPHARGLGAGAARCRVARGGRVAEW